MAVSCYVSLPRCAKEEKGKSFLSPDIPGCRARSFTQSDNERGNISLPMPSEHEIRGIPACLGELSELIVPDFDHAKRLDLDAVKTHRYVPGLRAEAVAWHGIRTLGPAVVLVVSPRKMLRARSVVGIKG